MFSIKKSRSYEHYNRAMGKYITSKKHYEEEMRKGGYVTFEENEKAVAKYQRDNIKPFDKPSQKSMDLIRNIASMEPDKHGKIKLSGRQIDAMKERGVCFNPTFRPEDMKGGF